MKASSEGKSAVVELLLEAGADKEAKNKVRQKDIARDFQKTHAHGGEGYDKSKLRECTTFILHCFLV